MVEFEPNERHRTGTELTTAAAGVCEFVRGVATGTTRREAAIRSHSLQH